MAHYNVLMVIKKRKGKVITEDDFYNILEENCTDEYYGEKIEPFGFDYLARPIGICKIADLSKYEFSDIIIDGKEIWWCDGVSNDKPNTSKDEAIKMIDKDDCCMLFDGHL